MGELLAVSLRQCTFREYVGRHRNFLKVVTKPRPPPCLAIAEGEVLELDHCLQGPLTKLAPTPPPNLAKSIYPACGALFSARTTPQPSQNLVEPWWNPGATLVEPWWNPGGTLVEPWPPQSLSGLRPQSFQLLGKKEANTFLEKQGPQATPIPFLALSKPWSWTSRPPQSRGWGS